MSNNTNNIQSQNAAATYERLYQVYNNVAAIDAPNQFMQLPQEIQNQVYGQVFELAGRPLTNDSWWGGHNAFRDLPRLQQAIQRVAFNNYLAMPVEQRNAIAGRVYENSGRPQTNDPQWGQNHANDNVDRLFQSIIEGMGSTTSSSSSPSNGTHSEPSRSTIIENRENNRLEDSEDRNWSRDLRGDEEIRRRREHRRREHRAEEIRVRNMIHTNWDIDGDLLETILISPFFEHLDTDDQRREFMVGLGIRERIATVNNQLYSTSSSTTQTTTTQTTTRPALVQNIMALLEPVAGEPNIAHAIREAILIDMRPLLTSISSPSLEQSLLTRAQDLYDVVRRNLRASETSTSLSSSTTQTTSRDSRNVSFTSSNSSTVGSGTRFSRQNNEITPVNSRFADDDFVNDDEDIQEVMRRFNLVDESSSPSNSTISTTSTTSTTPITRPTAVSSGSGISNDRKEAALRRLNEIFSLGGNAKERFELVNAVTTFNLDEFLRNFDEHHASRRLEELMAWAGGIDDAKRERFSYAVRRYENGESPQERLVQTFNSKLFSYFDKKRNQPGVTQETVNNLKVQFQEIVDRIINANRGCVDQMLSQLQDMLLDIAVEDYIPAEGDRRLGKMLCRAGQELCKYKVDQFRGILNRQHPNQPHLADLERAVMQQVTGLLGLQGAAFTSGTHYVGMFRDEQVTDWANAAVSAFWDEYHPMDFLLDELSNIGSRMNIKLRTELLQWVVESYDIFDEDPEEPTDTDMNPILSVNFNPNSTRDNFRDGGVWTPAGALFVLEATGLIQRK